MSERIRVTILQGRSIPYKYGYNSPEEDYKKLLSLGVKNFKDTNADGRSTFTSLPHIVERFGLLKKGTKGVSSCEADVNYTKGSGNAFSELRGGKSLTYFSLADLIRATAELNKEAIVSYFNDCILQPLSEAIQAGPNGRNLLFHNNQDPAECSIPSYYFWNIIYNITPKNKKLIDFYVQNEMLPFIQKYGLVNFILSIDQTRFGEFNPNGDVAYSDAIEISILLSISASLDPITKLLIYNHYCMRTEVRAPLFRFREEYSDLFFPINSLFFSKDYHYDEIPIFETFRLFNGRYSNLLIILSEA